MSITCCKEKAVLVAVYEERPRKRLPPSENHHHHHRHYHHFHQIKNSTVGRGRGYNRKAELLEYARHLRSASGQPAASSSNSHTAPNTKQPPSVQIVAADSRKKRAINSPSCLGKWKFMMIRSIVNFRKEKKDKNNRVSTVSRMKVLVKSLQVQKKRRGVMSKLFAALHKHR